MSASTVSITANHGPTTRRRAVEKNLASGVSDLAAADIVTEPVNKDARLTSGGTVAAILRDVKKSPVQNQAKKSGLSKKSKKPLWLTVISILTKNLALLVILLGFVQMIRWTVLTYGRDGGDISVIPGDFDGKFFEMEKFVKTTIKAMQVQVNAIDRKLEDAIRSVKSEFNEKIENKGEEVALKLKALDARSDAFEKFMDAFGSKALLTKEEFSEFFEEFKKSRKESAGVDEIMDYAREIVMKEIEKHASDGLGMVDYALASGGGRVVRHSEPYGGVRMVGSRIWSLIRNRVSVEAERMIRPSFGEPGQCFALKGENGFVEVRLRNAIVVEAVTLEHVSKSVAYDSSSAPKHCRVSGWMQGEGSPSSVMNPDKMFLLTEFMYDLEKSSAQTFKVGPAASNLVDTIRLDFTSNHGSATHTCIYRLRVHGHEPNPGPTLELQY